MNYKEILEDVTEVLRVFYWLTAIIINAVALIILLMMTFYII